MALEMQIMAHVAKKNNERRSQLICNIATLASVGEMRSKLSSCADEISAP